jgi:hypothetical protein
VRTSDDVRSRLRHGKTETLVPRIASPSGMVAGMAEPAWLAWPEVVRPLPIRCGPSGPARAGRMRHRLSARFTVLPKARAGRPGLGSRKLNYGRIARTRAFAVLRNGNLNTVGKAVAFDRRATITVLATGFPLHHGHPERAEGNIP